MGANRISRLTEREREILRLVGQGLRSKEIALQLRLSPLTVDDHLKSARRTLEVSSRHAAASVLASWEEASPISGTLMGALPDHDYLPPEPARAASLFEPHAVYEFASPERVRAGEPPSGVGRRVHDLTPAARLFAIPAAAVALVALTTGMATILRDSGPLIVRLAHPLYRLFG